MPVFADDRGDHHEGTSSSVLSLPDVAQRPTIDAQVQKTCPIELERHARLLQITSHGYAMADDEIMFQLQHIAACQSDANPRQFIVLPPLHLIQWLHGDDAALHDWISRNRHWLGVEDHHVFTVLLHEQHWIPIWLAPGHGGMMAHTHLLTLLLMKVRLTRFFSILYTNVVLPYLPFIGFHMGCRFKDCVE